jgi:hypothetical protein
VDHGAFGQSFFDGFGEGDEAPEDFAHFGVERLAAEGFEEE